MKDTVRKGVITETKGILKLLKLGYNVFTPYGDGSKCDLIIQNDKGILSKVQCKTSRENSFGTEIFNAYSTARTRSSEGTKKKVFYVKSEIDYFLSFDKDNNMYLIPIEEVKTQECRLNQFKKYIVG